MIHLSLSLDILLLPRPHDKSILGSFATMVLVTNVRANDRQEEYETGKQVSM